MMNGLGTAKCAGTTLDGYACPNVEIEGLDYCLSHMPDGLLEEAEQVTGVRRCRHKRGTPEFCRDHALPGSDPPACETHQPSVSQQNAARLVSLRLVKNQAMERATELIAQHQSRLASADPVSDPYTELMAVAGELREWKNVLREEVEKLERLRYQGKAGEQTRGEAVLYSNALNDVASLLVSISRLNLDAKLVGIRKQIAEMLDRALSLSLTAAQVPPEKIEEARETFRRHIRIVA